MESSTDYPHVNTHVELATFSQMLKQEREAHILFVRAPNGMGKTHLLAQFEAQCPEGNVATINLAAGNTTPEEFLEGLAGQLGRGRFVTYQSHLQEIAKVGGINIQDASFDRSSVDIRVEGSREIRDSRRRLLTSSFFQDLERLRGDQKVVVVLVDTYEKAPIETKDWLAGTFLSEIRRLRWVVAVIAGESVPDLDTNWERLRVLRDLEAFDAVTIQEYIQKRGFVVKADVLDFLVSARMPIGYLRLALETDHKGRRQG